MKRQERSVVLVTGNKHKFEIAERVLGLYNIRVHQKNLDSPEIQSDDIEEVASFSARHAVSEIGVPLAKTDVGFEIDALNGFPGAYGKYFFNKLGVEGILALMKGRDNRCARAIEVLAFADTEGNVKTFKMITEMTILEAPRGTGSVMDRLMVLEGDEKNYGSLTPDERLSWWEKNDNYFHAFSIWYINNGRKLFL